MPKDLDQADWDEAFFAKFETFGELINLADATPLKTEERQVANRFDSVFKLYRNYVEDDYEDWQPEDRPPANELSREDEARLLQRALESFNHPQFPPRKSLWQKVKAVAELVFFWRFSAACEPG